jgi:hypothetical protein
MPQPRLEMTAVRIGWLCIFLAALADPASAQNLIGPVDPPPQGVAIQTTGASGSSGGVTLQFSNDPLPSDTTVYWGMTPGGVEDTQASTRCAGFCLGYHMSGLRPLTLGTVHDLPVDESRVKRGP